MGNILPLYHFIWINKHWVFSALTPDALQFLKNMVHAFKFHSVFNMRSSSRGQNQLVEYSYNFFVLQFVQVVPKKKKKIMSNEGNRLIIFGLRPSSDAELFMSRT